MEGPNRPPNGVKSEKLDEFMAMLGGDRAAGRARQLERARVARENEQRRRQLRAQQYAQRVYDVEDDDGRPQRTAEEQAAIRDRTRQRRRAFADLLRDNENNPIGGNNDDQAQPDAAAALAVGGGQAAAAAADIAFDELDDPLIQPPAEDGAAHEPNA